MVKKKNTKTQKAWHGLWQDTRQRNRDTWPQKKTLQEKIDFVAHSVFLLEKEVDNLTETVRILDNKIESVGSELSKQLTMTKNGLSRQFDEVIKEIRDSRDDRLLVVHQ